MKFDNFEIFASPFLVGVTCPKDRSDMIELQNGFFSTVWYCKKCDAPYQLKMVKMRKWNNDVLKEKLSKLEQEKS